MNQPKKQLSENDDFTKSANRRSFVKLIQFIFFSYLSSISVFIFFITGIVGNSKNSAGDVFSVIYMTVGI
jgi:hypothetical protein